MIATYYGRQEQIKKNEIEQEMQLLAEEIEDMKSEGEILIAMDGNAKLGLLDEEISRNGHQLKQMIDLTNLLVLNQSNKCKGKITRRNTKDASEFSAIDFVVCTETAEKLIKDVYIDRAELFKLRGKIPTDHNTICINLSIPNIDKYKKEKQVVWNIGAPEEKWSEYRKELTKRQPKITAKMQNENIEMEQKYAKMVKEIDTAARNTIGKTTIKTNTRMKQSNEVKEINKSKRDLRHKIQKENDTLIRADLIHSHKELQDRAKRLQILEKTNEIEKKLEKLINDKTNRALWQLKKAVTRNPTAESMIVKNLRGERQFNPEYIKEATASYYEALYKMKKFPPRPYHEEISQKMILYSNDRNHENTIYNRQPTIEEITEIIMSKKNGKSAPDFKNKMLTKGGEPMIHFLEPFIRESWDKESTPSIFNRGFVTSLHKGKGDKEDLQNYRGITTSSSIGTIFDALIDNRIEYTIPFTQAQGGGQRGASTFDHLFLTRAMIDIAIKQKRPTFLTFYDVSKAFDNVNNQDMLTIMWDRGLRGKSWCILKSLNENLRAIMKTRFGPTREINMEIGGKQGSRLTGRMFSKLMDTLAEELQATGKGFKLSDEQIIAVLLWVDEVISCVDGEKEQEEILEKIHQFALKHRLVWGQSKCKVMRIGKHTNGPREWKLGDIIIEETTTYKYLGDIISNDGKNAKNLESRKNKIQMNTVLINSIAESEVLRRIETSTLIELHEKKNVPGLMANAGSWSLNRSETAELERIEVQALKYMFDLPTHTPTPAIIYTLGAMYTKQRIDKKRLMYLHRILNRENEKYTKQAFHILQQMNIGWGKSINEALTEYNLPTELNTIKKHKQTTLEENNNREDRDQECQQTIRRLSQKSKQYTCPKNKDSSYHTRSYNR